MDAAVAFAIPHVSRGNDRRPGQRRCFLLANGPVGSGHRSPRG
jgi:hypothetical protein